MALTLTVGAQSVQIKWLKRDVELYKNATHELCAAIAAGLRVIADVIRGTSPAKKEE